MTIVMGFDQHRAQITAEWLDTETGEVTRSRITPAHRQGVRGFCEKFRGQDLEVALEATTGWRFVADELSRVGAVVHLAEPVETAARRGNKKRAKSDRADARHIRELLTIGRLPESWIPPDHLLDLRAQVRLRHTLSHQRGEWQQRIQAVLYHHGCPQLVDPVEWGQRRSLMKNRRHTPAWLVRKLREADRMLGEGMQPPEVVKALECPRRRITAWRAQYGGMKADDVKRLKELERENVRLKRIVADQLLDSEGLKEIAKKLDILLSRPGSQPAAGRPALVQARR